MVTLMPSVEGMSDSAVEAIEDHLRSGTLNTEIAELSEEQMRPVRRLVWSRLLSVISGTDPQQWVEQMKNERLAYEELKMRHWDEFQVTDQDPKFCHPLSRDVDNPYLKIHANEELLQEIKKDVDRTHPGRVIFQQESTRHCLEQVLFHWCKAHNTQVEVPERYRQGMNEIVAVCYYVVLQGEYKGTNRDGLASNLCGPEHTEADTFSLLKGLMKQTLLREMFVIAVCKPLSPAAPSPILARCEHIFDNVLRRADAQLHGCIRGHGIVPQVFLLRWMRLLFCREFDLDNVVVLWTYIFEDAASVEGQAADLVPYVMEGSEREGIMAAEAASKALPLVDYIAVAMIVHLRASLLSLDESGCLECLLRFPHIESVFMLINGAKRLRAAKLHDMPLDPILPLSQEQSYNSSLDIRDRTPSKLKEQATTTNSLSFTERTKQFVMSRTGNFRGTGNRGHGSKLDNRIRPSPASAHSMVEVGISGSLEEFLGGAKSVSQSVSPSRRPINNENCMYKATTSTDEIKRLEIQVQALQDQLLIAEKEKAGLTSAIEQQGKEMQERIHRLEQENAAASEKIAQLTAVKSEEFEKHPSQDT